MKRIFGIYDEAELYRRIDNNEPMRISIPDFDPMNPDIEGTLLPISRAHDEEEIIRRLSDEG
jgi:hypothetical protein